MSPVDPQQHLDPVSDRLRERSVSGAAMSLVGQGIRFALRMASIYVLARLLTPEDYGLVGMVVAVTGLILLFKDLGLSMATVQRAEVTHEQISTLFWTNVALSSGIMLLTAAVAPLVGWFYREPRVVGITLAVSVGVLLSGLAVQHQAVLRRRMRFTTLAAIDVASDALGMIVAIAAAQFYNAGYWALVLQPLTAAALNLVCVWIACPWRPGRPARGTGVRPMLRYGGNLTFFRFANYLARSFDNVLVGRVWGPESLGLYARAYSLLLLPISQINAPIAGVAVPTLSRLQNDPERYRRYYLKSVGLIALLTMPLTALLATLSEETILLVLGPQWTPAAQLFLVFSIAAFAEPVVSTTGWVYLSLGQTGRLAKWGLLFASLRVLFFAAGLPWGAFGVAAGFTLGFWVLTPFVLWAAYRVSPIRVRDVLGAALRPAIVGLTVAGSAHLARGWLVGSGAGTIIAGGTLAAAAGVALLTLVWPALRRDILGVAALRRDLRVGDGASTTEDAGS